jgi:hypothetical protein
MTDHTAHAHDVLERTAYVVLGTADAAGHPWVTPVWFAHDGLGRIFWVSWPGSRHSELVAARPEIALTVFDSTVAPGEGAAFYATALARRVPDDELDDGLAVYNKVSRTQGLDGFTRERLTGSARLRLYVAEVSEAWVLDQDVAFDQRASVALSR